MVYRVENKDCSLCLLDACILIFLEYEATKLVPLLLAGQSPGPERHGCQDSLYGAFQSYAPARVGKVVFGIESKTIHP